METKHTPERLDLATLATTVQFQQQLIEELYKHVMLQNELIQGLSKAGLTLCEDIDRCFTDLTTQINAAFRERDELNNARAQHVVTALRALQVLALG